MNGILDLLLDQCQNSAQGSAAAAVRAGGVAVVITAAVLGGDVLEIVHGITVHVDAHGHDCYAALLQRSSLIGSIVSALRFAVGQEYDELGPARLRGTEDSLRSAQAQAVIRAVAPPRRTQATDGAQDTGQIAGQSEIRPVAAGEIVHTDAYLIAGSHQPCGKLGRGGLGYIQTVLLHLVGTDVAVTLRFVGAVGLPTA